MAGKQSPIGTAFGAATRVDHVMAGVNLKGKLAIVTGGYSGLGLETVRALAAAGASVVIPARDESGARRATEGIKGITICALDLMDPVSIDSFAACQLMTGRPLDLLVNAAGIMAPPLRRDSRGIESQFSTNFVGHQRLIIRLWDAMKLAQNARIIMVSSSAHRMGGVDFKDFNFQHRPYDKWLAYGQSKTATSLLAVAADKLGEPHDIRVFALHPGSVMGKLARHMSTEETTAAGVLNADGSPTIDPERDMKTLQQGAATVVWCATSPQLAGLGGVYCENCDIAAIVSGDSKARLGVRPWAIDSADAERLWALGLNLNAIEDVS